MTSLFRSAEWPTFMTCLALAFWPIRPAAAQNWTVSTAQASTQMWNVSNAIDGDIGTLWSTVTHAQAQNPESIDFWLDDTHLVNYVRLYPRWSQTTGVSFPVNFTVNYWDGLGWRAAYSYVHQPAPNQNDWVTLWLPETVSTNGIQVEASVLGQDGMGNYVFQLAEVGAGYDASVGDTDLDVSDVRASSALSPAANMGDGDLATIWSSTTHGSSGRTEALSYWFSSFERLNYIRLRPHFDQEALGFPVDFTVYWANGSRWIFAFTYENFPTPATNEWVTLVLPQGVTANGIQIVATTLGDDNAGNYVFQMAEVTAGYDPGFEQIGFVGNNGTANAITVGGVGSDSFTDPSRLGNWNYDARNPIIEPPLRNLRNIYAPNVVYNDGAWNIYFGGWDGVALPLDRVSLVTTNDDFMTFGSRAVVISPGEYIHVNNETVLKIGANDWRMLYTTYINDNNTNKPAYATSTDGINWTPSAGDRNYLLNMSGYPNWANADVNGGNVLYYANGTFHMYFHDFMDFSGVFHATSTDFVNWTYQQTVLEVEGGLVPNDMKRLSYGGSDYYMLALHRNNDAIQYSISQDLTSFPPASVLFPSNRTGDEYMTAVGLVTDGPRLYGALYGAGAVPELVRNRIFARWLQRKVHFVTDTSLLGVGEEANGPDRLVISTVPGDEVVTGRFLVYDTDGTSLLYRSPRVTARAGDIWEYRPMVDASTTVTIDDPVGGGTELDPTPLVRGMGEPGATVVVSVNGNVIMTGDPVVANGEGNWAVQVPVAMRLANGEHTVEVVASDALGNRATATSDFTVASNTVVAITSPVNNSVTNETMPTITGTTEAGAMVTVIIIEMDGNERTIEAEVAPDGSWSAPITTPIILGSYLVTATATDADGNMAEDSVLWFRVDTQTSVSIDSVDPLTGTVSGMGEPGATVDVVLDGTRVGSTIVGSDRTWSLVLGPLAAGERTIEARATDAAGNTATDTETVIGMIDGVDSVSGGALCATRAPVGASSRAVLGLLMVGLVLVARRRRA